MIQDAGFILLVYHQLICHADSDEAQERLSAEQAIPPPGYRPLGPGPWNDDLPHDAERVRDDLPAVPPPLSAVTPRDNRPKDTEKTVYRWNHVSDTDWHTWGPTGRRNWIDAKIKATGKSVVA